MFDFNIKTTNDKSSDILKLLKKLENTEVLVGIPEADDALKDGGGISNTQLLYIHMA